MLRTDWDRKICEEYKAKGCDGCPLKLYPFGVDACKATYHWSVEKGEWAVDESEVLHNLSRH